jgi:hypothetical protein
MSEPDDDKYLDDEKYFSEILEILKQKSDAGNGTAILMAVYQCALMRKPLPEWLREAFIKAYELVTAFEVRSWDDAFGKPQFGTQKGGAHLNRRKEYAELRYVVAVRVALRTSKEKISPNLFAKIGRELGVSKNKASDAYYKFGGKQFAESIEPLVPFLRRRLEKNFSTEQVIEPKQNSGKN